MLFFFFSNFVQFVCVIYDCSRLLCLYSLKCTLYMNEWVGKEKKVEEEEIERDR